jgi:myo-inositol-1(or 4)-monophosphatase
VPETATEVLALAEHAARSAGALLLEKAGAPVAGVGSKSSATDMVSDADRDAESLLRALITAERPDDAFVGEEGSDLAGSTGLTWVIDPLDGTTNFLFGFPQWSVSVACEDSEGAVAGVVYDPNRHELFAATRGGGATLNTEPISVRSEPDLAEALIATGFAYQPDVRARQAADLVEIIGRVRDIRRAGSAALDLCWVACGRLDGYFELGTQHWDRAAGMLIVSEAGGRSAPLDPQGDSGDGVVAASAVVFDALQELVEGVLHPPPADSLH